MLMCNATGYIEGDTFFELKQHTQHQNMAEEIQRLHLLERCRTIRHETIMQCNDFIQKCDAV